MKQNKGWIVLFAVSVAIATLSKGFIFRLVSGEFILGIIFVTALFIPQTLDWIYHLPLRRINIAISCDPLKPSASELCQHIQRAFRLVYSDGGNHLIYIAPMPNTGMRVAFNLSKQRIEARCGSEQFPAEESKYQLPPFCFDDSPVVYHLCGGANESIDGAYLLVRANRGEKLHVSKLRVGDKVIVFVDIAVVAVGAILGIWQVVLCAVILRRFNIASTKGFYAYALVVAAIAITIWRFYQLAW
jgi:hypothetical protein